MIIGLGGGSLARYLLYHFPTCKLKAVEYRASVVKIARSHFGLPLDSRLKVIVDDGGSYVHQQAQTHAEAYSLIMVDAFDVDGLANSIASIGFFDACKTLLKPDGMLLVNLWETEQTISGNCLTWLQKAFNDKILVLPVRNRGNLIVLAFNEATPCYRMEDLKQRAIELENRYYIEYPEFLKDIKKNNSYTIHAVIKQ
jgi:spermidine synthase